MYTNNTPVATGSVFGTISESLPFSYDYSEFEQKNGKPAIDDVICHYLDGETLKNALCFIDYVRSSKMKIKWSAVNVWSVQYKGKRVLDIIVKQDAWRVRLVFDHIAPGFGFTEYDVESIKNMVSTLRVSMPRYLEPTPVMS